MNLVFCDEKPRMRLGEAETEEKRKREIKEEREWYWEGKAAVFCAVFSSVSQTRARQGADGACLLACASLSYDLMRVNHENGSRSRSPSPPPLTGLERLRQEIRRPPLLKNCMLICRKKWPCLVRKMWVTWLRSISLRSDGRGVNCENTQIKWAVRCETSHRGRHSSTAIHFEQAIFSIAVSIHRQETKYLLPNTNWIPVCTWWQDPPWCFVIIRAWELLPLAPEGLRGLGSG